VLRPLHSLFGEQATQPDTIILGGQEFTTAQILMDDALLNRYIQRCNGSIWAAETIRDNFPLPPDHPISVDTIAEAKEYINDLPKIAHEYRQTVTGKKLTD
jgi:hypothetical protein